MKFKESDVLSPGNHLQTFDTGNKEISTSSLFQNSVILISLLHL